MPVFKSGNALDFVRIDSALIIFSIIRIMSLTVAGGWNYIYIHYSSVVVAIQNICSEFKKTIIWKKEDL